VLSFAAAMFRRSSYASVAAGSNVGQSQNMNAGPTRSGAFSHLANTSSTTGPQSVYPSAHHGRHYSRSHDVDAHHAHHAHYGSMAASWGRGGHASAYVGVPDGSSPAFFVPSYLRGSRYAEKLDDLHMAKLAAQRDYRSNHSSNAPSLSTSSSSVNLHKPVPSYRGMTHDIIERAPPFLDEPIATWPTRWNEGDKYAQLELEEGGRLAKFSGSQKTHDEAASVRSDNAMPRQCGIYYYEVTVVSKVKDG
jgi:hypothetical protein